MRKSQSKTRGQTQRAVVQSRGVDLIPSQAVSTSPDWQWRQGSSVPSKDAAPRRRKKGPPSTSLEAKKQAERQAQAQAYRAVVVQRAHGGKLAPHLAARVAAPAGDETAAQVSAPELHNWPLLATHGRMLVAREGRAFSALVLPFFLFALALGLDGAFGLRVKTGFVGDALAAFDQRMMEPGPALKELALARGRATEQAIIASLPEFPLVAAMPGLPVAGRIDLPSLRLASVSPELPPLPQSDLARGRIELPELALQSLPPAMPVETVALPHVTPVLPSNPSVMPLPDARVVAELPTVAPVEQCQRVPAFHSQDVARSAAMAVLAQSEIGDPTAFGRALAAAALIQVKDLSIYNAKYVQLAYPMGDVTTQFGVCSDVIVRAYRALGIDLQELVHLSRVGPADSNIDHRRTEMLRGFFARYGEALPMSAYVEDYLPGDIVTYYRPQNTSSTAHIAFVTDQIAPSGRPMIVHNRGWGVQVEDALFVDQITGHYRFRGMSAAAIAALPKSSRMVAAARRLNERVHVARTAERADAVEDTAAAIGARSVNARAVPSTAQSKPVRRGTVVTGLPVPMGLGVKPADGALR